MFGHFIYLASTDTLLNKTLQAKLWVIRSESSSNVLRKNKIKYQEHDFETIECILFYVLFVGFKNY